MTLGLDPGGVAATPRPSQCTSGPAPPRRKGIDGPPRSRTRARAVGSPGWPGTPRAAACRCFSPCCSPPSSSHQLGLERWGLFTLALALVGVFGVFDFGVGQSLTRALSERIGTGRGEEAAGLVGAALTTLAGISLVLAVLLWMGVPLLVERLLKVPPALQPQAIAAMRVLAAAAPVVVLNAALWGVLAAYQRFRAANLVTIPVNIFYYLGPVLVLLVWDDLMAVMLTLVAVRLANTISYLLLLRRLVRQVLGMKLRLRLVLPLLRLGGWMTFSGLLTQALLYADRFLIGALLSLAAVAWYATPLDLVLRVWMVPVAVAQTLLPAFASAYATLPLQTVALLRRGSLRWSWRWCCRWRWCWPAAANMSLPSGWGRISPPAAAWCCASLASASSSPAWPSCRRH